ncbi:MAG: RcnB family protein [Sphingomonas sp.]|uniref:RcnB family protein n=1 Tax=Sphingomonas sp. TaxID=28214 RepID=UPI001AC28D90|nr:RcnB family protein [Sphingomonas sp.]MBN8808286.1 RcnB family protein [Sphingomonas sp.]
MRKTLWIALLAAASIVPGVASAQDQNGGWHGRRGGDGQQSAPRGNGGEGRGEGRGNGGGWHGGGAPAPQAQPPQQAQPAQAPQPRPDWRGGGNGGWRGRGDGGVPQAQPEGGPGRNFGGWRGRGGDSPAPQAQPPQQAQPAPQGRPDWRGNGGNGGNWRGSDPRNGYGRPDQGYRGPDRFQGGDPRNGYRPPNAGNRPDGNNWRWNDGWRGGNNWRGGDRGGNWNRDWRGSGRYDWQRYRAENRSIFRLPRYYAPYGWSYGYRRFSIGFTLDRLLFSQSYWIDDPYEYRLPDAYGEFRWVRYYNDALLVDIYTGEVVDVVYGIFY